MMNRLNFFFFDAAWQTMFGMFMLLTISDTVIVYVLMFQNFTHDIYHELKISTPSRLLNNDDFRIE